MKAFGCSLREATTASKSYAWLREAPASQLHGSASASGSVPDSSVTDVGDTPEASAAASLQRKQDRWITQEQKDFWLRAEHYLNGTINKKAWSKHGGLMTNLRDALVAQRGNREKTKAELRQELIDHLAKCNDGAEVSSIMGPPEDESNLDSLTTPGHWFHCKLDENHIDHQWPPWHKGDHYIVGYHGTSVSRGFDTAKAGTMEAGPGQSANNVGKIYFFEEEQQAGCAFYQVYNFLSPQSAEDASPYLWAACIQTLINRNPKYGAGSYGKQRTQTPDTICMLSIHFCAVHCKELLNTRLRAQVRVHNGLFQANTVLLEQFKRHKTQEGATWLLDNLSAEDQTVEEGN